MSRQKKPLDEYESAGPMTRQRLKRQREGSEEDIWGNRNKGNSNNGSMSLRWTRSPSPLRCETVPTAHGRRVSPGRLARLDCRRGPRLGGRRHQGGQGEQPGNIVMDDLSSTVSAVATASHDRSVCPEELYLKQSRLASNSSTGH